MSVFRQIYLLEKRTMYKKIAEYSNLKAKIFEFFFTKGQFKGKQIKSKSNGEFFYHQVSLTMDIRTLVVSFLLWLV